MVDPFHVVVADSFFLGMGTIVVRAGTRGAVDGLVITGNSWTNKNEPSNQTVVRFVSNARRVGRPSVGQRHRRPQPPGTDASLSSGSRGKTGWLPVPLSSSC